MSVASGVRVGGVQECPAAGLALTTASGPQPDWWQRGLAHHLEGDLALAEWCYRQVPPSEPAYVCALGNLAVIRCAQQRFAESAHYCHLALGLRPDFVDAHINLANALSCLGRLEEAEAACRRALALQPDSLLSWGALGNVLSAMGRMAEAESCLRRVLAEDPDCVRSRLVLGNLLTQSGRHQEAEVAFRQVLAIHPQDGAALNNLGNVLSFFGRFTEARELLWKAVAVKPDDVQALLNLGVVSNNLGEYAEAEAYYRLALRYDANYLDPLSNLLFLQNYRGDGRLDGALADARLYGERVTAKARPYVHTPDPGAVDRTLRVGLVSGDLLNHPVGYFLDGLLPHLVGRNIELSVYSNHLQEDELTQRLRRVIPHWRTVFGVGDEELARRIHEDRVDVLVDLSGHTARNRLSVFAWKPAPVQVTWLGYFATTGVPAMDYILGDPYNLPESESDHFTETPWRLPDCYLCFTPPDPSPPVAPLPALQHGGITFGFFNNTNKLTDEVAACWSRILRGVPGSRLFLKNKLFLDPLLTQSMIDRLAAHGIAPDRLLLEGPSTRALYLTAYDRVDIALDSFPYPGVTTSVEGLWMGVPVITRKGRRFLSHQGESILANVGLCDWIAADCREYVDKAVAFASDLDGLAALRAGLRARMARSPLLDTALFARNLASAWQEMWRVWCRGGSSV
ncbi:MAG: tetratricopeptide repeat protein [Magnetococcales bacterium]|nr:tetratricopeptide repeat protein [Magnetococcales bacterium]